MIILKILGVWCAAIVICAPVLIPVVVRRLRLNFSNDFPRLGAHQGRRVS